MKKASVIRDETYSTMWRVRWPDGSLSDMANLSRANNAAARFNETQGREQRGRRSRVGAARTRLPAISAHDLPQGQITTLTASSSLAT